ncbi:MAG: tyrosine-type recombinase/integrase [Sphingobacteriales bacterium]|nr:tyrosine-type recombinase/integrase [Sphingobacteriales bacterium]
MPAVTYTEPRLCDYKGDVTKPWFVYFDITNPVTNQTISKQFRSGINYYHDTDERRKAGLALAKTWLKKLETGWNPWGLTDDPSPSSAVTALEKLSFIGALEFALKSYKASSATIRAYRTTVNDLKRAARSLSLHDVTAKDFRRQHVKLLLDCCLTSKNIPKGRQVWTNAAHNKNLTYLHALCEYLIEWEVLEYNPAHKIKPLPVAETEKYVPLTEKEKKDLYEFLVINHYKFFVYLMVLYHTGIRPKEILSLKIRDIDLTKPEIKIIPILEEENSKVKKIRYIPINNHLLPFLREMNLEEYSQDYYVFGSPFVSGKGNRGGGSSTGGVIGAARPEYFSPSPTRIKRDTVTKLWKSLIKEKLGIDKHQYAMKRTGGDDKILAGMELDELRELYGHGSKYMTEKYAKVVKEVYKKRIIENSPSFLPAAEK